MVNAVALYARATSTHSDGGERGSISIENRLSRTDLTDHRILIVLRNRAIAHVHPRGASWRQRVASRKNDFEGRWTARMRNAQSAGGGGHNRKTSTATSDCKRPSPRDLSRAQVGRLLALPANIVSTSIETMLTFRSNVLISTMIERKNHGLAVKIPTHSPRYSPAGAVLRRRDALGELPLGCGPTVQSKLSAL